MLCFSRNKPDQERYGYTRAVDMWALGCVCVVLLTGGLAFSDPVTGNYSEALARNCNLELLQKSKEWQNVRPRPRAFVESLLVFDENARMTAEEALVHPWFSNQIHKTDFEELYQRTIKHWHPRLTKVPIVEFQDSGSIRYLSCTQDYLDNNQNKAPPARNRGVSPVDAPYKPFPRTMHLSLWPKHNPKDRLSDEVLSAIESKWGAQTEPDLVWKAKLDLVPNGRLRSANDAGGASRRVATPVKASRESLVSRPSPRLTDSMSKLSFGQLFNDQETASNSKDTGTRVKAQRNFDTMRPVVRYSQKPQTSSEKGSRTGSLLEHRSTSTSTQTPTFKSVKGKGRAELPLNEDVIYHTEHTDNQSNGTTITDSAERPDTESEALSAAPSTMTDKKGSLKRRHSTTIWRANMKVKRRQGSIYDLSDFSESDSDSDGYGDEPAGQKPTFSS